MTDEEILSKLKSYVATGKELPDPFGPFLERPKSAVCPIFGKQNGQLELLGSSVLIKIYDTRFFLTAAHVLDHQKNYDLLVPGRDSIVHLEGYDAYIKIPKSGQRKDDAYDIGYYRIEDDMFHRLDPSLTFLERDDVELSDTSTQGDLYTVVGFPISKSEVIAKAAATEQFSLSGAASETWKYTKTRRSTQHHLLINFRVKRAINHRNLKPFSTPSTYGMSGGGVFAWNKDVASSLEIQPPKLVGILTEYHKAYSVFAGTRIHCFLDCIAKNNPNLGIKRNRTPLSVSKSNTSKMNFQSGEKIFVTIASQQGRRLACFGIVTGKGQFGPTVTVNSDELTLPLKDLELVEAKIDVIEGLAYYKGEIAGVVLVPDFLWKNPQP